MTKTLKILTMPIMAIIFLAGFALSVIAEPKKKTKVVKK
jgi:uncharacterized protein YaaW (UPF0174 family)